MSTMLDQFRRAIEDADLTPPDAILADGKWHRFASNGDPSDDAGWYRFSPDGVPAGSFGCFRSGITQKWCSKTDRQMSDAERTEYRRRLEEVRRQRDHEEQRRHVEAAQRALSIWESAKAADSAHPYLQRKGIQPYGLRMDDEHQLIVPVVIGDAIASVQFISPDPTVSKKFLYGGASKDGYFFLGEQQDDQPVLVCEGFATAASLHEATGALTVVAFSAGNLLSVATQARQQFPTATILVCGDNDARDDGKPNTGLLAATAAAEAVHGVLVMPELDGQKCDFNDLAQARGPDAVRAAIKAVLTREDAATDAPEEMPDDALPPGPIAEGASLAATIDDGQPREDAASGNEAPSPTTLCSSGDHGLTKELADMILRIDHFAQDAGGSLYVYNEGVYRPQGEARITQRVKAILLNHGETKRWSSHRAREVVAYIHVDAPVLWERPPVDILNCRNGLLSLSVQALRPHTPDHLSLVQLPVSFDPLATCPLWDSFVAQVLPDDCRGYPYELVAGSMCGDVSDQTAALAVGIGQTGKSTLLDAVSACLGRENVTNLALHRLENDKFAVVRLLGKLANICADLPSEHLTSTSTFKALTGGDSLTAERKFQSSFELRPFCRLIFSANHYPQSKDSSSAFFRRWLVIPFDTVIEPHQRIPKFAAQLADPGELSGVLNRALQVLPDMQRRGGFSQSETTQAAMQEFREMTDPLAA